MAERKPHKWAEVIKAWADGKPIQVRFKNSTFWIDEEFDSGVPLFNDSDREWRVKPEPVVVEKYIWLDAAHNETRISVSSSPNVRFTFDSDTKELVNVEVFR